MIEFKRLHLRMWSDVNTNDERLREIEATQQELKQSIEHSRELAAKSQRLLDRHRRELSKEN